MNTTRSIGDSIHTYIAQIRADSSVSSSENVGEMLCYVSELRGL